MVSTNLKSLNNIVWSRMLPCLYWGRYYAIREHSLKEPYLVHRGWGHGAT